MNIETDTLITVRDLPADASSVNHLLRFISSDHTSDVRHIARHKLNRILKNTLQSGGPVYKELVESMFGMLKVTSDSWTQRNLSDIILQQLLPDYDCRLVEYILGSELISPHVRRHVLQQLALPLKVGRSECYKAAAKKVASFLEANPEGAIAI